MEQCRSGNQENAIAYFERQNKIKIISNRQTDRMSDQASIDQQQKRTKNNFGSKLNEKKEKKYSTKLDNEPEHKQATNRRTSQLNNYGAKHLRERKQKSFKDLFGSIHFHSDPGSLFSFISSLPGLLCCMSLAHRTSLPIHPLSTKH